MRRRQDCLLATHPGAVVLHSKRRSRVVLSLFVCAPHSTLIFHLSRFRIALLPPHISHLPVLELASELTQINAESRRPPPHPFLCPPSPIPYVTPSLLCSFTIMFYPRSARTLLHLSLVLALVSFWIFSHNLASPSSEFPLPFPSLPLPSPLSPSSVQFF